MCVCVCVCVYSYLSFSFSFFLQEEAGDNPLGALETDNVTLDVTVPNPKSKLMAKRVDVISRILFPAGFAMFLIPYWSVYLR